ncbi:hypothetical protein, partial [Methylophaga sp.]|uniref:hypothetical protein n=1 Tax=Methylophaga sp. TaxID=2024840 RepID=UPI003A950632
ETPKRISATMPDLGYCARFGEMVSTFKIGTHFSDSSSRPNNGNIKRAISVRLHFLNTTILSLELRGWVNHEQV